MSFALELVKLMQNVTTLTRAHIHAGMSNGDGMTSTIARNYGNILAGAGSGGLATGVFSVTQTEIKNGEGPTLFYQYA